MSRSRMTLLVILMTVFSFVLAACGGGSTSQPSGGEQTGQTTGEKKRVTILGAFGGGEADAFEEVIKVFEAANPDIDVVYTGVNDFDTQIVVRVQAGDPPDIAGFPQPGGAARLAAEGNLVPLWPEVISLIDKNYAPFWKELGTFDGTPYGVFHRVNAKGFIWYNKPAFEAAGYKVPTTWEELKALTEQMKANGHTPWCDGIESGAATGWKGTDWIENIMLRTQTTAVYDKWISGEVPFSSPEVKRAFEILGEVWFTDGNVFGGRQSIVLTNFGDAATFLFTEPPNCWLHLQGSFVTNFFQDSVKADLDNKVGLFVMPPIDPNVTPALEVGGDVFVMLKGRDRPEVRKFMEFMATGASATPWARLGGGIFPHKDQDLTVYPTSIERQVAEAILAAQAARFDASDAMPAAVNAAFWKGVTDWASGTRDLDTVLAEIDAARNQ
ncbi:ABC transporter substrate-binding protein [Chloroflexus aggregans]|uniref:Extracellular solute-binding protein family 1 n=1 Tax=Chloroflexus aggregans (strain MD-66 / DSM 9485) TaxID=326427 RepID=B8GAH7_CHLAD|nr:ABC transporter substrate-binding protein [Chloroflexus aggregans]ACL26552.1 extracellular solute-binding protein family 1 [Chloroflexus aggregans DSM 9485]